jgi:hypothetical protein
MDAGTPKPESETPQKDVKPNPRLAKLSEYVEFGTKATPIVWIVGFVVFLRYCLEISYFPEMTLSAFAGFLATIFSLGLLIVITFLFFWYLPSTFLRDTLREWQDFESERKLFVGQIYLWIIISLICPCLTLIVIFGKDIQGYKGDWQVPF